MKNKSDICDIKGIVESINYPTELIDFFITNRDSIIDAWVEYPTMCEIRNKLHFSKNDYKHNIATKVVEYFFTLLNRKNNPGDCPAMRNIVNQFYDKGLEVEDVFYNCIALKNVVVKHMIKECNSFVIKYLEDVVLVLDYNLKNVLSMYSDKIHLNEKKLEEKSHIIDENVLFTRTDPKGKILSISEAFSKLSGYSKDELVGKTHSILRDPDVDSSLYKELWSTIKSGKIWRGSFSNIKKDGSKYIARIRIVPIFDSNDKIIEYIAFRYDITASELAKFDPLTQLYNKSSFEDFFDKYRDKKQTLSILIVDLDHFKKVNDTYGHLKGDEILIKFADILRKNTRDDDICSRWGGEEFIILLPNSNIKTAYEIAERIRVSTEEELSIDNQAISCSIGVAQVKDNESYEKLFKRVDKYLYQAKSTGRNKTVVE
jgi:diguanylate cyclase (GGDEF)-like protein/PAS domain S-box-containing protein